MDRENSLTLLWPEWRSNPVRSVPQSRASNRLRHRPGHAWHVMCVYYVIIATLWEAKTLDVITLLHNLIFDIKKLSISSFSYQQEKLVSTLSFPSCEVDDRLISYQLSVRCINN
jgi:hypothetical protein